MFLYENVSSWLKISLKFVPKVPVNGIPVFGSDNGWAPSRRQAIIWTNDGKFTHTYMRHSVSINYEYTDVLHLGDSLWFFKWV